MLQLNYFCLLGTGNIKVSVKLTVFWDHQTTDRKAGAVRENRSICKLIIFLFSKVVNTRLEGYLSATVEKKQICQIAPSVQVIR